MTKECELILYHGTTKENLKGILREGLRPGMSGGWCDLAIKQVVEELAGFSEEDIKEDIEALVAYRQECKENIFFFASPFKFEEEGAMPRGINTIIILCVPKDKVFIKRVPFSEWIENNDIYNIYKEGNITVRDVIPPENIIGYLNIIEMMEGMSPGNAKYIIEEWEE